ncbi:MAG: universal stress protein [Comamonas sp.]|jgi:nucleotide-binding universal stress UspA family protein|uniref:universal stress protein n=1 Tax=Comamonas sp. TaxID=34028 RepID=UPI000FAB2244|nr:universal stress protein [uncultured Comamonas sp.]MBP7646453.1 universal stress protein [Comamonas sp.]
MYERILVATDGSSLSDKAVSHAMDLAKLSGASVVALKVIPRYPRSYLEGGATVDLSEIKRIEAQWADQAQSVLNKIKMDGKAMGVTVKTSIAKSDLIAESIIAAADKQNVDLIVMASHGRKGIKRLLLGSETQHVLTHSQVPVLVLR